MNENEQTIYGIPVSNLSKDPVSVANGTYYTFSGYSLYVPDEVDASTSAFIYYPGSGGAGNDARVVRNIIDNGSANQILIIADDAYTDRNTGGARHLQLIENIGAANGVEITNIDSMGFSASGPTAFNTILNTIQNYPESGPHSAIFCDVVGFSVSQEQIDTLVADESSLLFLEPVNTVTDFERKLAQGGVDVVLAWTNGSHAAHVALNSEALQNGIIDFVTGESDELANSDIYTFVTYDMNSGEWYEISLEEVAEKFVSADIVENPYRYYDRLSAIDNELQCNNNFLGTKINAIRTAIKNSNFLSTKRMEDYSSTTQIPNVESDDVQTYFGLCAKILNCLEKDTSRIIAIGNSIDEINDSLKKDASSLNDSVNYYTNASTDSKSDSTSSSSSSTNGTSTSNVSGTYSTSTSSSSSSSSSSITTGLTYAGTSVGSYVSDSIDSSSSNSNSELTIEDKVKEFKSEFLKYNQLYSDDEEKVLVYKNVEENYKVVIHYENDEILAIDHYYQFPTRQDAMNHMSILKEQYGTNCEDILRETNTLKVVMEESSYENLTLTKLIEEYEKADDMVRFQKLENPVK